MKVCKLVLKNKEWCLTEEGLAVLNDKTIDDEIIYKNSEVWPLPLVNLQLIPEGYTVNAIAIPAQLCLGGIKSKITGEELIYNFFITNADNEDLNVFYDYAYASANYLNMPKEDFEKLQIRKQKLEGQRTMLI